MYPAVKTVMPRENYTLDITFNNGEVGLLDMKPYLDFGYLRALKIINVLKKSLWLSIPLNGNPVLILIPNLCTKNAGSIS